MRSFFTSLFFILFTSLLLANDGPYFYTTTAKSGDGVYALMRRYKLTSSACNLSKFYELNQMEKGASLIKGKEYKLPIYIYNYNGKSIRSTIGDNDMEKALRIKQYNEDIKAKGLRKTLYTASKILWVPYNEINCTDVKTGSNGDEAPVVSSSVDVLNVPLFGDKLSKVKVVDHRLKGHVYYVVSGHGGPDPGAMCNKCENVLCEDEYAYDVSLRLARDLMQHGATVHMIIQDKNDGIRDERNLKCDRDEKCMGTQKIPFNHKKRLIQRSMAINSLYKQYKKQGVKVQRTIVIHVDSRSESKSQDVFFYYHKKSKEGKNLAENMQEVFKKKYDKYQKGRGYKGTVRHRNLHMVRTTATPTVFVELANIRNKFDHKRIKIAENRQALANWMFEGLTDIKM